MISFGAASGQDLGPAGGPAGEPKTSEKQETVSKTSFLGFTVDPVDSPLGGEEIWKSKKPLVNQLSGRHGGFCEHYFREEV